MRRGAILAQSGVFLIFGLFSDSAREARQWDLPVKIEGTVVVHFTGGGRTGTIVWAPGRSGQLTVATARTRAGRRITAALGVVAGGPAVTARVERDGGRACGDVSSTFFNLASVRSGRNSVRFALAGTGPRDPGFQLTETRCGGPLSEDVAHALPAVTVGRRQLTKGGFTIDMRRSGAFAGGGVHGTVESSIVMTVGKRKPARRERVPEEFKPRPVRFMRIRYEVERVTGSVQGRFDGIGPTCAELDSCGAQAAWTVRPLLRRGAFELDVTGPARRPLRDFRTAAGLSNAGNARGIDVFGLGAWSSRAATATATFARGGDTECSDTRHIGATGLSLQPRGRTLRVLLALSGTPTRTSCAGPALVNDSSESEGGLATGSIPLRAFAHRRVVIRLTGGLAPSTEGWSGRTSANVTVTLRRTRTRVRVFKF